IALQQIEREVRIDQALEAPKSLLTCNARILALLGQLQRMRRAQILGRRERDTGRDTQDKQPCTHTLTSGENLERPINLTVMLLDCGGKLENPERTHACTGRTCKLCVERSPAGIRTQDLLAARQQCYQQPSDEAGPGFSLRVEIYRCCESKDFPLAAPALWRMIFLGGSFSNCWDARKKIRAAPGHVSPPSALWARGPKYNLLAQTTLTIEHVREGFKTHDLTLSSIPFWLPRYGNMCCCLVAQPLCMTRFGFEICKVRMRSMQRCRHVASWVGCSRRTNLLE
uniref:Uncharacterized protein n=1 Tax=Xiphophorus couchianus TaxID=32473 RepID=A0A3B5MHP2_9TELE